LSFRHIRRPDEDFPRQKNAAAIIVCTMSDAFDLSGKVALVTGSSRGIGAAIARRLASHGATIIVNYVTDTDGTNLADAQRVAADTGGSIQQCDVGNEKEVAGMFGQIASLDILINNAGILRDKSLKKMTEDEWEAVLRVNLTGAFHCIRHALPLLRAQGRIVNISSVNAYMGFFGTANYAAAKAGLLALTKTAAREFARQQITVNAIAPGFVDTEMTRGIPPEALQEHLKRIPLGRLASVSDIADAALFLCSAAAGYITGQVLHVNGGYFMP
jgi:3-oxoacyl-[acyl-carrier protein] reductase